MGVRNALTFIGAVIGSVYGQPQLGAMIGPAIGGSEDPLVLAASEPPERSHQ